MDATLFLTLMTKHANHLKGNIRLLLPSIYRRMLNVLSYNSYYCDDCFSGLSRARSRKHLEALDSVYTHVQRPVYVCTETNCYAIAFLRSHLAPVIT